MLVEVRLFAGARQRAGRDRLSLELGEPATVATLKAALAEGWPELAGLLPASRVAVHDEYADDDRPIEPGAEVALIPPVSGGGPDQGPTR